MIIARALFWAIVEIVLTLAFVLLEEIPGEP